MKDIPIPFVRAQQMTMVILTLLSIGFQSVLLLAVTLIIVGVPLLFGPKFNVVFMLAKQYIKDYQNKETESAELQRFNQTIAVSLLTIALFTLLVFGHWIGWVFVGMVTVAASVALLGFCVGCFLYFQLKRLNYNLKK